jgi:hypothetical protein
VGYFTELMATNEDVHESIRPLLRLTRDMISRSQKLDDGLISSLERDPVLKERDQYRGIVGIVPAKRGFGFGSIAPGRFPGGPLSPLAIPEKFCSGIP